MATATLPTLSSSSSIDSLISAITKGLSGTSNTTTPAFTGQLETILNEMISGTGQYSKLSAISDSTGAIQNLVNQTLKQSVPKSAAALRQSGLYNSSTKTLLDNDANAQLATQMAALVSQNIKDYATIEANRVQAASGASKAGATTGAASTGTALKAAAVPALTSLLLGEGKKALGNFFADDTAAAAASVPSIASAGTDRLGDFISSLGISGTDTATSAASGSSDVLGDFISSLGVSDVASGAGDLLGNLFSSIGSGASDLFSSVGDFFGGFFEDGGKVPMRKATVNSEGEIEGPKSKSGRDNMIIAVQGGEGILPPDVMEVPGVEELLESLIKTYHKPGAKMTGKDEKED